MADGPQTLADISSDVVSEKKEMRVELVRRLMLKGVKSIKEIRQSLLSLSPPIDLTPRTIYRYRGLIARRNVLAVRKKEGLNKTIEELAIELKYTFDEVSRELWRQYHSPIKLRVRCPHPDHKNCEHHADISINAGAMKVAALKEIRETASKQLDILQSMGLVNTAPIKVQTVDKDGNPVDPVSADKVILNQQFISFIKARYQEPTGVNKETPPAAVHEGKSQN